MHWIDISIIVVYLSLIFSVGILMRNRINNFSSFMIAGQGLGLSLGVTSMLGTELGLITVMYNAQTGALQYFSAFHSVVISQWVLKSQVFHVPHLFAWWGCTSIPQEHAHHLCFHCYYGIK